MAENTAAIPESVSLPLQRSRHINVGVILWRVLLYVVVLWGAVIFAIPFYWMIRTAVMPPYQVNLFPPEWIPDSINFVNFRSPFVGPFPFARWFGNSAIVSVLSSVGVVLSASFVGFGFARLRFPFRNLLFIVVLSTMMLPEHIKLIPTYLLFVKLGWINTVLPLIVPNWFAPPFHVFLMRQFFMTIPQEMDDAAKIDGCGWLGIYGRIHIPLSLPVMGVSAIYQFTFTWNDFLHPLVYLQQVDKYTVALGLRLFEGYMRSNIQDMMASALIAVMPTIIIFFIAQRYFIQGIVMTGVKG